MAPKKPPRKYHVQRQKRSQAEDAEVRELEAVLAEQAPPRGSNPLALEAAPDRPPTFAAARKFEELPLSRYTKDALREAKFVTLTAIQRAALPHALCGRDVLGAAKTGSGKTLAFLIPLVEALYRRKWNRLDGLGALVVSPTRELAMQIFEELRRVGRRHELSAGLLIGGKDVAEEAERVAGMNVLVATPGRLLQHMDETPGFDASGLQVLVLDEADRILDMGFSATLNAIVANLPRRRQTLLFSATQTKSLSALARLSLKDPEYVEAHAAAEAPTPVRLEQAYIECRAPDKLNLLWSFVKTHLRARTIVFFSTCKQVRFVYEAFRRLRPGVPLRALHGHMSQYKRMAVYRDFCADRAGVLFATDVAARGLDFPAVDWVVQADCPEDVAAYIHRVGRTARYTSAGRGLLLLAPSESAAMRTQLASAKVPLKALRHNPERLQPVTPALQALLSKDAELKGMAQRALVAYLRSVFLQPNRAVFDVAALPAEELALSMGLPTAPKLRFLRRAGAGAGGAKGEAPPDGIKSGSKRERSEDGGDDDDDGHDEPEARRSAPEDGAAGEEDEVDGRDDDDLLVVKRRDIYNAAAGGEDGTAAGAEPGAGAGAGAPGRKKRLRIKPGRGSGTRVVFDDAGRAVDPLSVLGADGGDGGDEGNAAGGGGGGGLHSGAHASVAERGAAARAVMAQRDAGDRAALRDLRKSARDAKRARRLAREQEESGGETGSDGSGADGAGGSSGGEGEDEDGGARRGFDADMLMDSDDDDGSGGGAVWAGASGGGRRAAGAKEVAHMGMAPPEQKALPVPADQMAPPGSASGSKRRRQPRPAGGAHAALTLADQEALALRLLRK